MQTQLLLYFAEVQVQQPLNYLEDRVEKFSVLFEKFFHSFSNTLLKGLVSRPWTTITNKMTLTILTIAEVHAYLFLNCCHFGIPHCSAAFHISREHIWWVFSLRMSNDKVFGINKLWNSAETVIFAKQIHQPMKESLSRGKNGNCSPPRYSSFLLASRYVWSNQKEMKFQVDSFPLKCLKCPVHQCWIWIATAISINRSL